MPLNAMLTRSPTPERVSYDVRILGTGAADPTREVGADAGVVVTRTGTGVYRFQFDHNPGKYLGQEVSLIATAMGTALLGFTFVFGDWDATNLRIDATLGNASNAAADLAAAQRIALVFNFARTQAAG